MSSFQGRGPRQGKWFAEGCRMVLQDHGFRLLGTHRIPEIGVEIDEVILNKNDVPIYVEFKGSLHGKRPGLFRTDTVKKAIANGYLLSEAAKDPELVKVLPCGPAPFIIIASHVPDEDKQSAYNMLRVTSREVVYMAFELMQSDEPLRWLAEADGYDLAEDMRRRPSLGNCVYFVKGESTCSIA